MSTSDPGARVESTPLTVEGPAGRLAARLERPTDPRRRAVICHPHPLYGGTMDNAVVRTGVARLLAAGCAVLSFDFRGVRQSEGAHDDGVGEQLDLLAAEREVELRVPGSRHWLVGYSFGAYVALGRLGRVEAPRVDAVVALAPPLSHRAWTPPPDGHRPPIALITGEHDELTPQGAIERFLAASRGLAGHQRVAGAGHDLGAGSAPGRRGLESALDRAIADLIERGG